MIKRIYAEERRMLWHRWFTTNKQAPYIMMMVGGVGFALLAKLMSGESNETDQTDFLALIGDAFKEAAPLGGIAAMLLASRGTDKAFEWTGEGLAALGGACLLADAASGSSSIQGDVTLPAMLLRKVA